jgi:glycerol-3-phosphate acyltransferase PlsY
MSPTAWTISFALAAYLLGGIPLSLLLGLSRGADIRKMGGGNVRAWLLERERPDGAFPAIEAFGVAVAILVLVRHGSNLRRILRGEEPTFQRKGGSARGREANRGES